MSDVKITPEARRYPNLYRNLNGLSSSPDDPPVAVPDFAIQLFSCSIPGVNEIVNSILDDFHHQSPPIYPDVRGKCITNNNTFVVGIWITFVDPTSPEHQARNRALDALDLGVPPGGFSFFANSSYLRSEAYRLWGEQPKRLNGSGSPDPNGPIHLTGFDIKFQDTDRIITHISGYDDRPWPDVPFTLTITEILEGSGGAIHLTNKTDLETDPGVFAFLSAALVATPFWPLGLLAFGEVILIAFMTPDITGVPSVGTYLFEKIPSEIMIKTVPPLTKPSKALLTYFSSDAFIPGILISEGGIFLKGIFGIADREPGISGLQHIHLPVDEGDQFVDYTHKLTTFDLRPELQIDWSVDGSSAGHTNLYGTRPSRRIRYDCTGIEFGAPISKRLSVKITDADGLQVEFGCLVDIVARPPLDPGLPAICRNRPWLPQCDPDNL